jgi:N-acetylglucosamine-6-phosphate deacetylase
MLVTDAMPPVGTDDRAFTLQGRTIRREDGRLLDDAGVIAGSILTMDAAVREVIAETGVSLTDALTMAAATPAAFLGLGDETGAIAPGLRADLVLLDGDLNVQRTWIGGAEARA